QVFLSADYLDDIEKSFRAIMDTARQTQGIHPQLAHGLKRTLDDVGKMGKDIDKAKKRRTMPRTWKDCNSTTLYLD
ncbi:hypothetical protein EV361DRAFT_811015, partial [Lentinula raphanica]